MSNAGDLKTVTSTDPFPFAQGKNSEVWEVLAQPDCGQSEIHGICAIVVSYDQNVTYAVSMFLDAEEETKLPHRFYAVVIDEKLFFIPIKNQLEPYPQPTYCLDGSR